ncbi:MAG: hypothetical protein O7D94_05520, partial [Planctomycetota bacterium]|nr:hypothetical protein [Planctomycetota bacterium]
GCRVEIGTDEFTAGEPHSGDLDGSGGVDLSDVPIFVSTLLGEGSALDECSADLNGDGSADGDDLQSFVDALLSPGQ